MDRYDGVHPLFVLCAFTVAMVTHTAAWPSPCTFCWRGTENCASDHWHASIVPISRWLPPQLSRQQIATMDLFPIHVQWTDEETNQLVPACLLWTCGEADGWPDRGVPVGEGQPQDFTKHPQSFRKSAVSRASSSPRWEKQCSQVLTYMTIVEAICNVLIFSGFETFQFQGYPRTTYSKKCSI
jgi:hypothetical protein